MIFHAGIRVDACYWNVQETYLKIEVLSRRFYDAHFKGEAAWPLSYVYNENPYMERRSRYWDGSLVHTSRLDTFWLTYTGSGMCCKSIPRDAKHYIKILFFLYRDVD